MLAGNLVRRPRPDVIRPQKIVGLGALFPADPVQARQDLLRGFLPGINNISGLLDANFSHLRKFWVIL